MRPTLASSAIAALSLLGCSPPPPPPVDAGVDVGGASPDAAFSGQITYTEHVASILAEHCAPCHSEGGIAPFPLTSFEESAPLAARLAQVTRERLMPPFLADASGACGEFRDARWLSDTEIATLEAWSSAGAPEGPPLPPPAARVLPVLDGANGVLDMGVSFMPTEYDETQCFLVDSGLASDGFLTGFDVHPGERRIVHHLIVYHPADDAALAELRADDAADPRAGFPCTVAMDENWPLLAWVPGNGATYYPEGTGVRISARTPLVLQVHYNQSGAGGVVGLSDRTTVELRVEPRVDNELQLVPVADLDMRLPPRQPNATTEIVQAAPGTASETFRIWGALAHMHQLATTQRITLAPGDAAERCLLDIPRWDYAWQLAYFFDEPIDIRGGQRISVRCSYDTTTRDEETVWGETTQDEMCLAFLYASR